MSITLYLCVYCFAIRMTLSVSQTENMHIGNFKLALESMGLATSNSCCGNALGAILLVTVPHSLRHILHTYLVYAYTIS